MTLDLDRLEESARKALDFSDADVWLSYTKTPAPTEVLALVAVAKFGAWCFNEMRCDGGGDIDGGAAQDRALEFGLLVRANVTQPCGENCYCAEYYGDFAGGVECIRTSDIVDALKREEKSRG